MRVIRKLVLGAIVALSLALPAVAAERAIIVLDGSGSMWAQIDGKARITIARETLASVLSTLPKDLELGFMTYGHREKGNCADIEMLVEPAAGTGPAIIAAAKGINPKGMTPISDAVRLAAEDLRFTEEKATVILITDGLETCEVDPCALASDLEAQGVDFTTHVLGFGLSDEEGQKVACLAENTGGQYLSAADGAALVDALTTTVAQVVQAAPAPKPAPAPAVLDYNILPTASFSEGGPDLKDDRADLIWSIHEIGPDGKAGVWVKNEYNSGAKLSVEPGDYIMRAEYGKASVDQTITVVEGKLLEPHFVLNAGIVTVRAFAAEGQPVNTDAQIQMTYPGGSTSGWGEETFRLPAGEQTLTIDLGKAHYEETFTLAAGESLTRDIVVGTGVAVVDAVYVEGMDVTDGDLSIHIYGAKKAIDGSREEFGYGFGPGSSYDLPAGDYVAHVEMDAAVAEVPFSVKVGERVEVVVVLNAGVAAFTTPGLEIARIYGAKPGIDGTRPEFGYEFATEWQTTLTEGDYVLAAEFKTGATKEVPFSVVAGERVEVTAAPGSGKVK
ncbi:VWA domain-containing protein [Devosia sp. 2618]|uniref:vWA domain-containing protein n=1 Tax=Devosia sp. 2618 TaxID=3156454 RepID=UPI003391C271